MKCCKVRFRIQEGNPLLFKVGTDDPLGFRPDLSYIMTTGTRDYNQLKNKPTINGVEVIEHKTGDDYHLQNKMHAMTVQEIEKLIYLD